MIKLISFMEMNIYIYNMILRLLTDSSWRTDQAYWQGQYEKMLLLKKYECLGRPNPIRCMGCCPKRVAFTDAEISKRAYIIWQKTGNEDSQANWYLAIKELDMENSCRDCLFQKHL